MRQPKKMQFMSGICAEKALVQHLCKRFHYLNTTHICILIDLITIQTQILRTRGFDVHMPDILLLYKCIGGSKRKPGLV